MVRNQRIKIPDCPWGNLSQWDFVDGMRCEPVFGTREEAALNRKSGPGTIILNPISKSGQPVRLYITAVTGASGFLNFELEQYPH